MDETIDQQQQLLSSSSEPTNGVTLIDDNLLEDDQPEQIQEIPSSTPKILDWNTEMIARICREGDIALARGFVEYSRQNTRCCEKAGEIADRLDTDTGLSPLHNVARYQQLDICIMLLSNIDFKFGVNIKDAHGRTPIHSAFRNNLNQNNSKFEKQLDVEIDFGKKIQESIKWIDEYINTIHLHDHPIIYLFAKANGDIFARDKYLLTPLHYAVAHNNLSGIKQLIKLDADIESRDRQDIRPLHLACKEGYVSIAKYLIEQGAEIDASDADQWTPLHYACAKGHLDIIKLIRLNSKQNFDENIQMKTNTTLSCLHLAVQHGNIQSVKYILTQFNKQYLDILINEQSQPFGTPLHIAAKFSDPKMLRLLHRFGANPLILNSHNQSSLHIACSTNRLSIVQQLYSLTKSSLLEIKDDHGRTPLSLTTNVNIVNELITYNADISSLDNNHMNVLMIAVSKGRISIVEHLLFIINNQSNDILNQVTQHDNRSLFLIAVDTGSIEICSLLLANPYIRWDTIDSQSMNAFHIAAKNNHHKLIEYLCKLIQTLDKTRSYSRSITTDLDLISISQISSNLRLYIDAQNEDGKTPLHFAAEYGHILSIKILLKYGADVLLTNYFGQLALHVAIQNGYTECVNLLIQYSIRNLSNFQYVLSRKQSPLITACYNDFVDIVRLLLSHHIGIDDDDDDDDNIDEDNPLEIAIKYRRIEIIHELLEHAYAENWLMSIRTTEDNTHQTPLREMIRSIPECVKHVFDKLITKTTEIDSKGNTIERITYNYKYIDDYFMDNGKLYDTNRNRLYRNHPFIIALDTEHHLLLEHPLARQLMSYKWKLYSPIFYLSLILTLLLLFIVTFYVIIIPPPNLNTNISWIQKLKIPLSWIIVSLANINLFKILLEIILYRGLRVPFAQLFGIISFLTSIIGFIPYGKSNEIIHWQWELAACSILFQWFNIAFILRSVPSIGNVIVMVQSTLINIISLIFVILPLLIAFTISTEMIFYNHSSFLTILSSIHKLSAMLIGEFAFENLFFSKPIFLVAMLIFTPFIFIMTIIFMNLLLGLTVGDIQSCMDNASAKANAYRIRELIYIESTLPSISWLRKNIIDEQTTNDDKDSIFKKTTEQEDEENKDLSTRQRISELEKFYDIINMLSSQAKQVLEQEIHLEIMLKQLLLAHKSHHHQISIE